MRGWLMSVAVALAAALGALAMWLHMRDRSEGRWWCSDGRCYDTRDECDHAGELSHYDFNAQCGRRKTAYCYDARCWSLIDVCNAFGDLDTARHGNEFQRDKGDCGPAH